MSQSSDAPLAARRAARNAALAWQKDLRGLDDFESTVPCGHAKGLGISTRLTTNYRQTHRSGSMDVQPQQVIDCLISAGVKNWCLMGLHGYVGYLPQPRATQDVDVMVPENQKQKAMRAISERWPKLEKQVFDVVIRFVDPGEIDIHGRPVPVIDLMLPFSAFHGTILNDHVLVEESTGSRLPTLEAAIVCKYAALVSPNRKFEKKNQDATDLARLIISNHPNYQLNQITKLADEVWQGAGVEIQEFIDCALNEKPFPV